MMMRQGDQVLTELRLEHEEKQMSVRFITRLIDRKEDSTEDWFKKSFWNILAQDYII